MPPKAKPPAKKKNGYVLAEKFTSGFQLKDIFKTTWTIGEPIGQGGFGLIYLASKGEVSRVTSENADHVVKIEPKDNGPLFCETHFYINCAKEDDINSFMKAYRLKTLAIPRYISSGLCVYNSKDFRFLVMHRYTRDLQTILNETNHILPEHSVLYITRQILYALEYIHSKGYAHGDIKGANLLLRNDKEVYLVDYGLATRFSREGTHQNYLEKPERKHNGTIEYTSRDAHNGVLPSRRADLEILGYCIVHWLAGSLPWMNVLTNPTEVQKLKIANMKNVKEFVKNVFKTSVNDVSDSVKTFVEYFLNIVVKLEFNEEPKYLEIQTKLSQAIQASGYQNEENFELISHKAKTSTQAKRKMPLSNGNRKAKSRVHESENDDEDDNDDEVDIKDSISKRVRKNLVIENSPLNAAKSIFKKHEQSGKESSPTLKKTPKKKIAYDDDSSDVEEIFDNEEIISKKKVHAKNTLNLLSENKSTRSSPARSVDDKYSSRLRTTSRVVSYSEYDDNSNENKNDASPARGRTTLRTTPSRKVKEHESSVANSNGTSTLTSTVAEHKQDFVVVKKRNLSRSTQSTQTEASCLTKAKAKR